MKAILDEMNIRAEEEQRRIDRITGYLIFAGSLLDSRSLGKLLTVMEAEGAEAALAGEKLRAVLKSIREQESQKQRRELMRSLLMGLLLAIVLSVLMVNMPTRAQESGDLATNTAELVIAPLEATPLPVEVTAEPTPEAPPVVVVQQPSEDSNLLDLVQQAMPYFAAIAITLLVVIGTLGHQAIVNLGRSAPAPVREVAISGGDAILKQVEEYVLSTPTPVDDAVAKEARRLFDQFIDEWRTKLPLNTDQPGQVG